MKLRYIKSFLLIYFIFFTISILSIYSSTLFISSLEHNILIKQFIWYMVGFFIILIIYRYKNHINFFYIWFFYILFCFLLLFLLFFGTPINNSRCWFLIPGVGSFQPSEFMKVILIILLSKVTYIYNLKNTHNFFSSFKYILFCVVLTTVPAILTFLQPDTGAVLIYFIICFSIIFFSGIDIKWFIFIIGFIFIILFIMYYLYLYRENTFISIFGTSLYYRFERISIWQDSSNIQFSNSIISIGSSSIFGYGLKRLPLYFPESSTDFIFTVFASSFGFIGVIFLLLIVFYYNYVILKQIKKSNYLYKYLLIGFISMLFFQQIYNIGMSIGLFPIMGITLPFISYGGSNLLANTILFALVINIYSFNLTYNYKEKDRLILS